MKSYTSYKFNELGDEIARQDHKHGTFSAETDLGKLRLGIACLEDEVEEARNAWREERGHARPRGWRHTREELLQVAAVAIRCIRLIDGPGENPVEGM